LAKKLPEHELKIIALKYSMAPLSQIKNADELLEQVIAILKRVHVITGWNLPNSESYMNDLAEEFVIMVRDSFPTMNGNQIIDAFRKHGVGVTDWGKNMNLTLMAQVMGKYYYDVEQLSIIEEKNNSKVEQVIYTDEEIKNQRRGHLEMAYQVLRRGKMPIIFPYYAEVLVTDGFIEKPEDMDQFFSDCLGKGIENLYVKD